MVEDILTAARRMVRDEVDRRLVEMTRRVGDIEPIAVSAQQAGRQTGQRVLDLVARIALLEGLALSFRQAILPLPILTVGANPTPVTWDTPFVDDSYGTMLTLEAGVVALGKLTAGILAGSRTAQGLTVVVINSAAVSIPAGAQLHVLAWRVLGQGVH